MQRFCAKLTLPNDPDGCWRWSGARNARGYGRMGTNRAEWWYAHRYAYERFVGDIPAGLVIDHLCRNTGCVNPAHLEAVTHAVNLRRGQGLTGQRSRQTHCLRGHLFDADNTGYRPNGTRKCIACAKARRRGYAERAKC